METSVRNKILLNFALIGISYNMFANLILNVINYIMELFSINNLTNNITNTEVDMYFIMYGLIVSIIIAPIIEELICRVVIMKILNKFLPYKWALILQALLFGVLHKGLLSIISAFVIGLIMGHIYNKYNKISYSISIHMGANFMVIFTRVLLHFLAKVIKPNNFMSNLILIITGLIGVKIFIYSVKQIKKLNINHEMNTNPSLKGKLNRAI